MSELDYKYKKIYFMLNEDSKQLKIGVSYKPIARLNQLQTACGSRLKLLFALACHRGNNYEFVLHKFFNHLRLEGEWFKWNNYTMSKVGRLYQDYFLDDGYIDRDYEYESSHMWDEDRFQSTLLSHLDCM